MQEQKIESKKEEWKKEDYKTLRNEVLQLLGENPKKVSEKILKEILKHEYIYTTRDDINNEMWIYKEGIYIPQGKSFVREICREILGSFYNRMVAGSVTGKLEVDTAIDQETFFNSTYENEIPIINGILNVKTKELKPFDPTKIFFNKINAEYKPNIQCPKIKKFLSEILPNEEDNKVIFEIGGFALLNEYIYEKAFMFVGNGRNGKSKLLTLFKEFFNPKNCCAVPLVSLIPNSFNLSELFGKRINLAGDISYEALKDTSIFKSCTGRDKIQAHRKFKSDICFENNAKFVFSCNDLPMVYDTSTGFWDRWVLLEFPFLFKTAEEIELATEEEKKIMKLKDDNIISKILSPEELSGLLNEFLAGLDRLTTKKRFSSTRGSKAIKDLWIRKANSFLAFALDFIIEDSQNLMKKSELRQKYSHWCKENKVKTKTDKDILRILQENFGASEERRTMLTGRILDYGKEKIAEKEYTHVWEGINWNPKKKEELKIK